MQVSGMFTGSTEPAVPVVFPGFRSLDHKTVLRIVEFLLVLGTLFLSDILTTQIILRIGGTELNPFMTGIVANPIQHLVLKTAILLIIFPVSLIAEQKVKGSGDFFYCILILLYTTVVLNNLLFILPRIAM